MKDIPCKNCGWLHVDGLCTYSNSCISLKDQQPVYSAWRPRETIAKHNDNPPGVKYDDSKLRWSLLPLKQIEQVVQVLMYGSKKYADNNWQKVENPGERYYNAAMRHLCAYRHGEKLDPESRLSHLASCICSLIFLMWFDDRV